MLFQMLIAAAQRVEHYEIAAYGTARQLASDLDLDGIRDLMDQTLDEESQADKLLTKIATGGPCWLETPAARPMSAASRRPFRSSAGSPPIHSCVPAR